MHVYIDADGCPVVDLTIEICKKYNLDCTIVADSAHNIIRKYATTLAVPKGTDSADFKIVNLILKNDIVITQDYGLAAMCMAKHAQVINQDGLLYTQENIDGLLFYRNEARKLRTAKKRSPHMKKRTQEQNKQFELSFCTLINKIQGDIRL